MGHQQQQLLRQELTVSQILRVYGKKFTQITGQYSDGHDGRCAIGLIMSYFGWNGTDDYRASRKLLNALVALAHTGASKDLVIQLNDSGMSFDELADYLDQVQVLTSEDLMHY